MCGRRAIPWRVRNKKSKDGFDHWCSWLEDFEVTQGIFRGDALRGVERKGSAMEVGARSDTGRVRGNNEDSFRLAPELNLFVLSDGMGGLEAGERASRLATETVLTHCRDAHADAALAVFGKQIEGVSEVCNRLASAIRLANREIHQAAQDL